MTDAPNSPERGRIVNEVGTKLLWVPWVLRVEALVCFVWPLLGLLSALMFWEFSDGLAGGHDKALYIGTVVCGAGGIYGLFALTNAATHAERIVLHPILLLGSLCLGAAACGAAVRRWDLGWLTTIGLPLMAIGHFLLLTRRQFTHARAASDESTTGRALGRWAAVGAAAVFGVVLAGPKMGLQPDYTTEPFVSRAAIETAYGDLLDQIDALPEPQTDSAVAKADLIQRIAADPVLIYARLDVVTATKPTEIWFEHANRDHEGFECYMRSEVMQRDGLIRCRMRSNGELVDMLRYGRYGLDGRRLVLPSRNLELYFDYQKLLTTLPPQDRPRLKSKAP